MERKVVVRAAAGFAAYIFLVPALLFISAGTLNWPIGWLYVAILLFATVASRLIVYVRSPDTLRERARFVSSEGTQSWDRVLVTIIGLLGPMAMMIVAGLDYRFGWSQLIPGQVQLLAAAIVALGYGLGVWAMVVNPFFSSVVRLQQDRGQTVVATGPYRLVRHPSYAGALLADFAVPVMLNSLWALLPGLVMAIALVIRTRLEDRMLRDGLPGYEDYAAHTRYRLIPGMW